MEMGKLGMKMVRIIGIDNLLVNFYKQLNRVICI